MHQRSTLRLRPHCGTECLGYCHFVHTKLTTRHFLPCYQKHWQSDSGRGIIDSNMLSFARINRRQLLNILLAASLMLTSGCAAIQRRFLFYPTHHNDNSGLSPWIMDGKFIGYSRQVPAPENVWLMLHGNAGQAADRTYTFDSFSERDSVFILEYPSRGPVEIFGAQQDTVIPLEHARKLAGSIRSARFHCIQGGHNEWSLENRVAIRNP